MPRKREKVESAEEEEVLPPSNSVKSTWSKSRQSTSKSKNKEESTHIPSESKNVSKTAKCTRTRKNTKNIKTDDTESSEKTDVKDSPYFATATQKDGQTGKSKSRKRKDKSESDSSFASKIQKLKSNLESGSDSDFEAVNVSYRSPENKTESVTARKSNWSNRNFKKGEDFIAKADGETDTVDSQQDTTQESSNRNKRNSLAHKNTQVKSNSELAKGKQRKEMQIKPSSDDNNEKKRKWSKVNVRNKDIGLCEGVKQKRTSKKTSNSSNEVNKKKKSEIVENHDSSKQANTVEDSEEQANVEMGSKSSGDEMVEVDAEKPPESVIAHPNTSELSKKAVEVLTKTNTATALPKSVDFSDAMALLLHMEGPKLAVPVVVPSTSAGDSHDVEAMSDEEEDSEEEDWEDVEDHHGNSPKKSQLPSGPVEITLQAPVLYKKRKKGEFDLQAYFRRQINKFKREVAIDIHKVHLLCLLARCQYLNQLSQEETLQAQALSVTLVTKELKLPSPQTCTVTHVEQVLTWMKLKKQYLVEIMKETLHDMTEQLRITLICVLLLRQVGFLTRLMASLQPVPFKEAGSKGTSSKKGKALKSSGTSKSKNSHKSASKTDAKTERKKSKSKVMSEHENNQLNSIKSEGNIKQEPGVIEAECKTVKAKPAKALVKRRSSDRKSSKVMKGAYREAEDSEDNVLDDDDDDDYKPDVSENYDEDNAGKKTGKSKKKKGTVKKEFEDSTVEETISDSDFEEENILLRTQQLRRLTTGSRNQRILSTDVEDDDQPTGNDNWAEVYLSKEQKWLCIDCVSIQVKKPYEIENLATQPVSYVVGISQDGYMRDVTARYASQWLTDTRKLRVDSEWWQETLSPYKCTDRRMEDLEDEDLNSHLQQRPLPTSVGAFKSHPLYALRRHLLKFEAIYPDTSIPVGYIRGEPVYARECVHTLHSRENWLKEGRAVRIGEEPYKFVKSRSKWNRPKEDPEAKDLELFGRWQTEVYIPPPAVDGKVPRNAHGNVEMFLPSMLPAGTVHLKIPGLNKVAKKLDIDCAPAMVGWDHHCGFSHPLMDGWIVCEEYKDILLAAWDEEQEIIREKEQQKREKRVYDNWRKLIRGMLIKERLKKRFDLEDKPMEDRPGEDVHQSISSQSEVAPDTPLNRTPEKATDVKHAWPQNRLPSGLQSTHTLSTVEKL